MELNIKNVRKAKGISVSEMCNLLNVTENTYRKYELHPEEMKVKHAIVVAKALKLPIQVFFYENN